MATYLTPGVYVEETPGFPPSITGVRTALPAFIGHTEKAERDGLPLTLVATQISSMTEYEAIFGGPAQHVTVWVNTENLMDHATADRTFYLYDSLRLFFLNGGGPCMIVSVGDYGDCVSAELMAEGLASLEALAGPTLIVMPDAVLTEDNGVQLYAAALAQCAQLRNRMVICDLGPHATHTGFEQVVDTFRNGIGTGHLKHGTCYGPWLVTSLVRKLEFSHLTLKRISDGVEILPEHLTDDAATLALIARIRMEEQGQAGTTALQGLYRSLYDRSGLFSIWIEEAAKVLNILPPSGAVAGIYAKVDSQRGVWKAPANIAVEQCLKPVVDIQEELQDSLNVHASGKSINAIRRFTGKGTLVWGARTLAGNDNEWRYISVRRFFNFVEASITGGLQSWAFEPNEAPTWVQAKAMIENFLVKLWRDGALQGAKPEQAFFVNIGLNSSMTQVDIAEGRMLVEVGLASVRPAEFIILRFTQDMGRE